MTLTDEVGKMVISGRPCEEAEVVCNNADVACVDDGQKRLNCIGTAKVTPRLSPLCSTNEFETEVPRRADILSHIAARTK